MSSFAAPALMLVVLVPIVGALALAPLVRAPWPKARLALLLGAHLAALAGALQVTREMARRGGFATGLDYWTGARAEAVDPLGLVPLVLTPSTALVLLTLLAVACLAALVLVPHALQARSTALHTALLLATGALVLLLIARRTDAIAAAFSLCSLCGFTLFAAALPKRDEGMGAVRTFALHRVGDVALFAAVLAIGGAAGGLDHERLLEVSHLSAWARIADGPLAGFAAREAWLAAGVLIVVAAATRLAFVPAQALVRDAIGLPGAALGFVYGACFAGAGLIVLLRFLPALWLAPEALTVLGALAIASAIVAAALALVGRDLVRIDVMLLLGFGALVAVAIAAGDTASAVLGLVCLLGAAVPLCATGGTVVVATGRTDPYLLGGLERSMPRTHTARLLATGALFGPLFTGATLSALLSTDALASPWLGAAVAITLPIATALLALAAFRSLHLAFTGAAPREPLAKLAADPPWRVSLPLIAAALPLLGLGLAHLPAGVIVLLFPDRTYQSPISMLVSRELVELQPLRELVLPEPVLVSQSPALLALFAIGAATIGWAASSALYRGGPGRIHHALLGGARAQAVLDVFARLAGRESQVARGVGEGAARLSRIIATNLAPGLLEALLRRLPAMAGALLGAAVRLMANGSAQRGLTVALLGLLLLAARFSGLWDPFGAER